MQLQNRGFQEVGLMRGNGSLTANFSISSRRDAGRIAPGGVRCADGTRGKHVKTLPAPEGGGGKSIHNFLDTLQSYLFNSPLKCGSHAIVPRSRFDYTEREVNYAPGFIA